MNMYNVHLIIGVAPQFTPRILRKIRDLNIDSNINVFYRVKHNSYELVKLIRNKLLIPHEQVVIIIDINFGTDQILYECIASHIHKIYFGENITSCLYGVSPRVMFRDMNIDEITDNDFSNYIHHFKNEEIIVLDGVKKEVTLLNAS